MHLIKLFHCGIGLPNRGKTGGLRGHNVHADTVIHAHVVNAFTEELHYLIVYIAVGEYSTDNRQSDILRTYTLCRLTGHMYAHYLRHVDVVGLIEELLNKLRAALTHCHGTQCTVTGMAVGTENHLTAACQHFSCKLVNNSLMRRNVNTAVTLCAGKTKHVVILVDGTAYRTKTVMAVGQNIRNRELGESAGSCGLNNTYERNIVGGKLIKLNL